MTLRSFLYLTQLEEYDTKRIYTWLANNPNREVTEIKKQLVWTNKIRLLSFIAHLLFFLPPERSVLLGLQLLHPLDSFLKFLFVTIASLKLRLFHHQLRTIVITGSWGKTTCKDTLLHLISTKYHTQSTTANQNTLLGIAKKVLFLPSNTQIFIVEAGAYQPGDIAAICRLVKPQIGIITAIGPMHLERFGTQDNIQKTKMELAVSIFPQGQLYLPQDQKSSLSKFPIHTKNIHFFDNLDQVYHHLGQQFGLQNITTSLKSLPISDHRLQIIKNGSISIIDDTYNSNPVGFRLALDKLKSLKSKNNILVTPGMIELGSLQASENSRLIKLADTICQHLILVGQTNRSAFQSALKKPKSTVHYVQTISEAQSILSSISTPNSAILFENDLPDQYF